jgi:outer membrane protein assembly factor BamD (BamD/ComL family)
MINAVIEYKHTLLIILLIISAGCTGRPAVMHDQEPPPGDLEKVFAHAASLVNKGDYQEAARLYRKFTERYPDHVLADDAAYRYAYLHVTADPANPLYDYENAQVLFQNFIETYQNSRYISACKNWLAVLQSRIGHIGPAVPDEGIVTQLKQQISDLKSENQKLRTTLAELQQAIER